MKKAKKKIEYKFKDIILDSKPELEFCYYLEELKKAGYIEKWDREEEFKMTEGLVIEYEELVELKTKTKVVNGQQRLLHDSDYKVDFVIRFTSKAKNIFCKSLKAAILKKEKIVTPFICDECGVSHIEIKPSTTFDPNNMLRLFRLNQKFMWKTHGIYVNLVVPCDLFKDTFTPQEVVIPKDRKERKDKWERKGLKEYVNGRA